MYIHESKMHDPCRARLEPLNLWSRKHQTGEISDKAAAGGSKEQDNYDLEVL